MLQHSIEPRLALEILQYAKLVQILKSITKLWLMLFFWAGKVPNSHYKFPSISPRCFVTEHLVEISVMDQ